MRVTVMYRNNYFGGDGWEYYPKTIDIGNHCPVCGGKRGNPIPRSFCEDGEWYVLDTWENLCGHVDSYKNCLLEAAANL
jgi:hypothetical protein